MEYTIEDFLSIIKSASGKELLSIKKMTESNFENISHKKEQEERMAKNGNPNQLAHAQKDFAFAEFYLDRVNKEVEERQFSQFDENQNIKNKIDKHLSNNISKYNNTISTNLKQSEIFSIPDSKPTSKKVAVMMPFSKSLDPVINKIKNVCNDLELDCFRADDIWENQTIIQDVFSLIYTSEIVIADFTGKNPNVFYEVGIAHTLGKIVIPLTQSLSDIPFDLTHHRVLKYLPNNEGIENLGVELKKRLKYIYK